MSRQRTALFSPEAGFHKARFDRISITVQRADGFAKGLHYWNLLAGWDLFLFAAEGDDPDITTNVIPENGCRSCALVTEPYARWKQPYVRCNVDIVPKWRDTQTVAHELGHCLGFKHQLRSTKSVMAIDRVTRKGKRFDRKLLKEAGYR